MSQLQEKILETYEKGDRFLNKQFVDSIPWHEVKNHPLDKKFLPVLVYMRDVEAFTDIYYQQLIKTPTGRDPIIRRFMDKWQHEEMLHAELLDRFLNEAGIPTSKNWFAEARAKIPKKFAVTGRLGSFLSNCVGKRFSAVHMTWGAINELSTLQGYKRLWETANHPVLEYLLRGIAREESSHVFFYRSIAKLQLQESRFSQRLARYIIEKLWKPVGQGLKEAVQTNYVIGTLFNSEEGMNAVRTHINGSLQRLPGFSNFTTITDRVGDAIIASKKVTSLPLISTKESFPL